MNARDYNDKAINSYNKQQYKDAQQAFIQAIKLDPKYAEAYANLGALYAKFKEYKKAIKLYKECIKLKPSYSGAYTNLGNALNKTYYHEEAIYFHKIAIELDSKSANHFANCASAYKNLGRFDKAISLYKKAISIDTDHIDAHFDLATIYLQTGEYEKGWSEYEWRFKKDEMLGHIQKHKTIFSKEQYKGQSLQGQKVLVHSEQGFGDTLMMARYLKELHKRGATIALYLRDGLVELFETLIYVDAVYVRDQRVPEFDFQVSFMSLAYILDPTLTKLTKNYPYFDIDEKFELENNEDRFKIGIVWGASKTGESYKNKVFSLEHFKQMAKNKKIQLYSLQLGDDKDDILNYSLQNNIIDLSKDIDNFYTTAKIINSLDLVITSDTSVAHLAGAMGANVWILLQKVPDWRWGVSEFMSSWYPSARLFHQYSLRDFNSVFRQVYKELNAKL